jgi:hypothetical protein
MKRGRRTDRVAQAIGEAMTYGNCIMTFDMLHNFASSGYYYIPYDREGEYLGLPPRESIFQEVAQMQTQLMLKGELESEYAILFTSRLGTLPNALIKDMDVRSIRVQLIRFCSKFPWELDKLKKDYLRSADGQGNIYEYNDGEITTIDWDYGDMHV